MSRLTAPGFTRLKAPGYSGIRPRSAIVSSANGTTAPQDTSGSASQQIPSATAAPQARSALKKPFNSKLTENQQDQTKVVKPVIPGLSQPKGSKSTTKLAANQAAQHGTGPYDLPTSQSSGNIPYVGKKRSSGVLKAPDSRTNMTKPQLHNGTDKRNDTFVADPKAAKKKIIPPKSAENGIFAVPAKPSSKQRVSLPLNKGCSDLTKMDPSRRQTISTPDSTRSNSKLASTKNPVGIRPRSCVMPTEMKKSDQKKVISKSLQNIPKSIPMPSMNKGLNKKDVRKSGSHDDILNCTKKEPAIKRPVAGVIPRTKSGGFTSKFGFSTPAQPRASSATTMHSTPDISHNNQNQRTLGDEKLSPIGDKSNFDVKSTTETVNTDEYPDTKTINIIINLEEYNTNTNLSKKDGVSMGAPVNGTMFSNSSTPNKTSNGDLDLNKVAVDSQLNSTINLNKTRDIDLNDTQVLRKTEHFSPAVAVVNGNETFDVSPPFDETQNIDLNETRTLDSSPKYLHSAHILHENNNNCLNKTINIGTMGALINKTENINETIVLDNHPVNMNTTQIIPTDSMDKSDSGFDDTNFNISDILPPSFNSADVSYGDLSEDVLKVIAAISSNINRPSNITTFSQSPIKSHISSILQHDENICSVANEENAWLNEDVGQGVEDSISVSQTSHEDESNTLYQTDDLLSKSTSIDMSTITSNNTQWQDKSNLIKFSSNYNENVEPIIESRTFIEDEVFKDNLDTEDISLATDISQSTDQLRNCLSSIGTDTEDIEDIDALPDVNPHLPLNSQDSIFVGGKSHEIDDESSVTEHLSDVGLPSHNISSSMNSTHTLINHNSTHTLINHNILDTKHLLNTSVDRVNDIEIPTSIEYSDVNASITDKTSGICFTNDTTLDHCSESISKEIADAIIRDSGHSTDVNENEINSALSADLNKLNIEHVKADLFTELTDHRSEVCPSTPPTEFEKSMSSDATYPSTPLSRQESLEYDLARRCNTIDCTRKMRKVGRSRTYSSSELITKFRIPKELKCIETSEGDILMDKTTFLHFMNEVKLVKTSLLKLKRTLVEAQCTSPLVKSPLKRANSAVEASAIPPLSPRTCQCSPMAVVNPLVLTTGIVSTSTKEKESLLSLEDQIALLNEKLQDSANTVKALQTQLVDSTSSVKLLQTQLENHEQKEQDIIEENILLREEISHLTERLQNARVTEGGGEDGTTASFEDIDLAVDLDSRLSILQRLYSDG